MVLTVSIPAPWAGPFTICTKATAGWNDCLPLIGASGHTELVHAVVSDDLLLEVWLLDQGADLHNPIRLIATIDLSTIPKDVLFAPEGSVAKVSITGDRDTSQSSAAIVDAERASIYEALGS